MQALSADLRVPEPTPENLGLSEGLKRSNLNNGVLEKFAQNMTENIIQSLISQMEIVGPEVDCGMTRFDQNQEMLAEELASAVIEVALREVCGGQTVEDHQEGFQSSAGVKMDSGPAFMDESESGRDFLGMHTEMDPGKEIQTSKYTQPCHPPLSQSGFPVEGSLDYPDAPPTTPLLPGLERSRHSFARKLKGGLAKVFLPSPPPSTPTDDLTSDHFEAGPPRGAKMEAFAEALSCDIIDWVLRAKNREQIADDSNLHLLAHQLAETIITSSLDEAKMLF